MPRWDGRTQQGQLLLWGEQGVGDEIFHASLLPLVPQDGIRITVAADKRLHAIFRRSFPYASVIDSSTLAMQKGAGWRSGGHSWARRRDAGCAPDILPAG